MIEPDTKDWTWVLDRPCPECGYAAAPVEVTDVADEIRRNAEVWRLVLAGPGASERPDPHTWSALEYACHVRDVHAIFTERLGLMLAEDGPRFPNWDQDVAAVEQRYDLADPAAVALDLVAAASVVADRYDAVPAAAHDRPGYRSDGSEFTVATLARYHLHDVVHHAWDVRRQVTVAAYDAQARAYRGASAPENAIVAAALDDFVGRIGAGAHVLEIGSGGGRDARAMEQRGLRVRRTDVTPGFVAALVDDGHQADVLDPLTDELGGPYDAVWANASLLHVARADLPTVLTRLAGATRTDGVLRLSVKQGDGEAWSTHGSIEAPRMFTYWRRPELVDVVAASGWRVDHVGEADGLRGERWLEVVAYRSLP